MFGARRAAVRAGTLTVARPSDSAIGRAFADRSSDHRPGGEISNPSESRTNATPVGAPASRASGSFVSRDNRRTSEPIEDRGRDLQREEQRGQHHVQRHDCDCQGEQEDDGELASERPRARRRSGPLVGACRHVSGEAAPDRYTSSTSGRVRLPARPPPDARRRGLSAELIPVPDAKSCRLPCICPDCAGL